MLAPEVTADGVAIDGERLRITLSDSREVSVVLSSVPWLAWLAAASAEQKANWTIEPGGFAVYWPDLDDGVEVAHLLERHALA